MTGLLACSLCATPVPDTGAFCPSCGSRVRPTDHSGRVVGGSFRLEERIGAGGMGVIYRARQLSLDKVVAVKVLHEHLATDDQIVERFHREAHAAGSLKHPHTISVIDFGQTEDGMLYIAMEYLDGLDLGRILGATPRLSPQRAVHIAMQVLESLDEAHAEGIVHRDLKPENIVLSRLRMEPDFVKVLDFGIAKIKDTKRTDGKGYRTTAGFVCGTPEYMAPEQVRGDPVDGRADLYAVGVVLFEMLTGQLPFSGGPALSIATRHLTAPPPLASTLVSGISPALETVVQRLLAKHPSDRYPTARAAYVALLGVARSFSSASLAVVTAAAAMQKSPAEGVDLRRLPCASRRRATTPGLTLFQRPAYQLWGVGAALLALSAGVTVALRGGFGASAQAATSGEDLALFPASVRQALLQPPQAELLPPRAPAPSKAVLVGPVPPPGPTRTPVARAAVQLATARELSSPEPQPRRAHERSAPQGVARAEAHARSAPQGVARAEARQPAPRPATPKLSKAETYERQADEAAKAGRWRDAIAAWLVANDLSPKPATLLNVARAYLRLGSRGRACVYLQRYERAKGAAGATAASALLAESGCR